MLTTLMTIFKNLGALLELVKMIKKTPQERHEEIFKSITKEADKLSKGDGRPDWS